MEEQTNKLLPYQLLLRKNNIQETDLKRGTQQLIADIKKIRNVLYAQTQRKGITNEIEVSEITQEKIDTYDRHICNDIFEYLDNLEEQNTNSQITNNQTTTHTNNETKDSNENSGKIGFWNWE